MSRSRHSSCRTSPTTIREGRIRSASLTSRRSGISPAPSRLGWRVCMATTSGSGTRSSKTSSAVITRSRAGIAAHRQLSSVVLPAWVPPETRMFSPAATAASRKRAAWAVIVPSATSSSRLCADSTNLRMLTAMCRRVMSGMTTCSREPSGSIASTNGVDMSIAATGRCAASARPGRPARRAPRIVVVSSLRPRAGDEHPARLVDPDLLDLGVVEVALQRPEPGHPVEHVADDRLRHPRSAAAPRSATARSSRRPRRAPAPAPAPGR